MRQLREGAGVDLPVIEDEGLETEELILNMGPQHPSTHGVLRLVLRLSGEKVVECVPVMGYLHRGLEKIFEWRTYAQGVRYADQADYVSNMLNEHAYAGAMEAIAGIDVPRRAEYIRVIVDELSRAASHLIWLGTYGLDLGATTPVLWCFRDREDILDMLEELCGSRMNFNYFRPGGVLYDLPVGWLAKLERFLDRWAKRIEQDYVEILDGNEIFLERTIGVGRIPADVAKSYGLTGPMLRACGVPWDLRVARPYGVYPELKSMAPVVFPEGDAFARYKVRLGEMRLAIKLIRECIDCNTFSMESREDPTAAIDAVLAMLEAKNCHPQQCLDGEAACRSPVALVTACPALGRQSTSPKMLPHDYLLSRAGSPPIAAGTPPRNPERGRADRRGNGNDNDRSNG